MKEIEKPKDNNKVETVKKRDNTSTIIMGILVSSLTGWMICKKKKVEE